MQSDNKLNSDAAASFTPSLKLQKHMTSMNVSGRKGPESFNNSIHSVIGDKND